MPSGKIFNIQHFSSEDGPGVRTTVFLKGCNLRCPWCHNPESQSTLIDIMYFSQKCVGCGRCTEVCPEHKLFTDSCRHCGKCAGVCPSGALVAYGKEMTVDEVASEVLEDKDLYDLSGGGVTFSGGEPLLQTDFLEEILSRLKKEGIHTAIETAGCYEFSRLGRVLPYTDYLFMDLKCLDDKKHTEVIGASNRLILDNIVKVASTDVTLVLRTPVIMGFNDGELSDIAEFVLTLPERVKIELLPYHEICSGKYEALRREFRVEGYRVPTENEMKEFKLLFGGRILQ